MTNEEAVEILDDKHVTVSMCLNSNLARVENEAIDKAIKALEFIEEIKKFAFNTDDDFYGEVLCRKLYKYGFIKKETDEWVDE